MKIQLKTIDGPTYNIELDDVSGIEMRGSRDSVAGWVTARLIMRSGAAIDNVKMLLADYDKLVEDWSTPPDPVPVVEDPDANAGLDE